MTAYVALLRAVNLAAASTLRMTDLKRLCEDAGFAAVQTYIASGNVVFTSEKSERAVKAAVEKALADFAGKAVPVMVRTAREMAAIAKASPFPNAPGNRVVAILLDAAPPRDALDHARHIDGEEIALGKREIYVRYTDHGMGKSKLVIPAAKAGTGRNMNTVAKLAEMAAAL